MHVDLWAHECHVIIIFTLDRRAHVGRVRRPALRAVSNCSLASAMSVSDPRCIATASRAPGNTDRFDALVLSTKATVAETAIDQVCEQRQFCLWTFEVYA